MKIDVAPNEIMLRIARGTEAAGFARFLEAAADAFETGKLLPTNPNHNGSIVLAADHIRIIAQKIRARNA